MGVGPVDQIGGNGRLLPSQCVESAAEAASSTHPREEVVILLLGPFVDNSGLMMMHHCRLLLDRHHVRLRLNGGRNLNLESHPRSHALRHSHLELLLRVRIRD